MAAAGLYEMMELFLLTDVFRENEIEYDAEKQGERRGEAGSV